MLLKYDCILDRWENEGYGVEIPAPRKAVNGIVKSLKLDVGYCTTLSNYVKNVLSILQDRISGQSGVALPATAERVQGAN